MERSQDVERVVVDASIIVKWFVPEKGYENAVKLLEEYAAGRVEIFSPSIATYETLNALRFHPHYKLSIHDLVDILQTIKDLQIIVEPSTQAWSRCIHLSLEHKITIYDAIYAATATEIDAQLVTADKTLASKLSSMQNIKIQIINDSI